MMGDGASRGVWMIRWTFVRKLKMKGILGGGGGEKTLKGEVEKTFKDVDLFFYYVAIIENER